MKVMGIKDIDKFFEVVDSCKGKVELVTGEGDRSEIQIVTVCISGKYLLKRRNSGTGDRCIRKRRY